MTAQQPDPADVEELPAIDHEGGVDHPDVVSDAEAAAGLAMWRSIDDLDDDDNGLPDYGGAL